MTNFHQITLHKINKGAYSIISLFVIFLFVACNTKKKATPTPKTIQQRVEELYLNQLEKVQLYCDSITQTSNPKLLQAHYAKAREFFKKVEPVLAFQDAENYKFFNAPNILKVDEEDLTSVKIKPAKSLQTLEEAIYADSLDVDHVHKTAKLLSSRVKLIHANTLFSYFKDYHFLWVLRNGFMRAALTGITGFDSPVLMQSQQEAVFVYQSLLSYLAIYEANFSDKALYRAWQTELKNAITTLKLGDFNSFDRYGFIKNHTHTQLALFNKTVADWQIEFPFTQAIQNDATSLFSYTTFNERHFSVDQKLPTSEQAVLLGKLLFNDKALATNGSMSCATCHIKSKAFTDGLPKSAGQLRNTPTLTYASLQQSFFYDNRAGSLEGQIVSVVNNDTEFHSNLKNLEDVVNENAQYIALYDSVYGSKISEFKIRNAMAQYIRSLNAFDSKFDRNITGAENTLSKNEINGFNLFMGKAKCATCHFAPIFNGTVPVSYKESEMELLGVPLKNDTINAVVDTDLGRYYFFKTEEKKHFFKTPTVRNIALTAPYMHNGVYKTLEEVIDFYNRGGGAGIGIDLELQTLPRDPLNLTDREQADLIAFLNTLTDQELEK